VGIILVDLCQTVCGEIAVLVLVLNYLWAEDPVSEKTSTVYRAEGDREASLFMALLSSFIGASRNIRNI